MPTVKLSPLFNDQAITSTGAPASGYKVYTYAAGSSTPLSTYTDATGTVAQTNPIVLNSNGFPTNGQIWLQSGLSYKLVFTDASGSVIKTEDNVSGINDTGNSASQWTASNATPTYVSATSFTLVGDQTTEFHVGRRIQTTVTAGTVYGKIVDSVYTTLTTVKVLLDSGALDSGLSVANLGLIRADTPAIEYLGNHGQCRLSKSGSNLLLSPFNGNRIVINGRIHTIPSAGTTLAPTSLTPSTLYYIYAYMNSGTMTLEASTTTHATDTATGIEIKSGDATRTLVGMVRPITGPAFADTVAQRFVRSWFNDPGVCTSASFTVNRSSAVTAGFGEISNEIRNEFLLWSGENPSIALTGTTVNSGTFSNYTGISIDSVTVAENGANQAYSNTASTGIPVSCVSNKPGLSEGYHFVTALGYVNGGTGTWTGGVAQGCQLSMSVHK